MASQEEVIMDARQTIRDELARIGMSQSELARRAGMTQPHVNRWLSGHADITAERLGVLCEVLGLDLRRGSARTRPRG